MADGTKYEGYQLENKKCGRGCLTFPSGQYYDGDWYDDKQHGYGKLSTVNGE